MIIMVLNQPLTELLEDAIKLGRIQEREIEKRYKIEVFGSLEVYRSLVENYLISAVKAYWNLSDYLLSIHRDGGDFFYLQGLNRTKIEVFSGLVEVLTSNDRTQILLILGDQLYFNSKYYSIAKSNTDKNSYLSIDKVIRENVASLIVEQGIILPTIGKFSQMYDRDRAKKGLKFQPVRKVLTKYLEGYGDSHPHNNLNAEGILNMYDIYSDHIHGSIFMHRNPNESNKKAGVFNVSLILDRLCLELINGKYLDGSMSGDVNKWIDRLVAIGK